MANQAKTTNVTISSDNISKYKGEALALGLFQGAKSVPAEFKALDKALGSAIGNIIQLKDFKGKLNETSILYVSGKVPVKRVILVGLGKSRGFKLDNIRQAAGTVARLAEKLSVQRLGLVLHTLLDKDQDPQLLGQAIAEGVVAGRYDYQDHVSANNDKTGGAMKITILESQASKVVKMNKGRRIGVIQAAGQNNARAVNNRPGNEINPPSLARHAQSMSRKYGLKCKVFNDKQLAEMKMGGILAVGQGSSSKPRLIMMEHKGRVGKSKGPDAVIVGKAVTFDSGGISLKPSLNMEAMKFDKSGGCSVLGLMTAVAQLKIPRHVVGLIPSVENLPSHTSYRPGDIIKTYSGKTVEIQNTDAEGRMILCDALSYAARMKPKVIIDIATLTGACVIALGEHHAGLFSNNDKLIEKLKAASEISGEPLWHMPSGEPYLDQMKSKIADLKNIGGRPGGSCTAAAFLSEFIGAAAWAHIDVAAVADTEKAKPYRGIGATGFTVRTILEYLRQ